MKYLLYAGIGAAASLLVWKRKRKSLLRQRVLITGGSRGLGLQLARELGAKGARVAICARDANELDRALDDLDSRGIQAISILCDVSDEADVDRMIERVHNAFGGIDILINNAAVIQVGPAASMEKSDFETAMNTIYWGTVHCTLAVLNQMRRRGEGTIANITSIGGLVGIPHLAPYSAAKFAVTGFSEAIGAEVGKDGIKVLTVAPGLMRTGSHLHARFKGDAPAEYAWFSAAASSPLLAISVERAARAIVRALEAGDSRLVLGAPAYLLSQTHAFATAFTGAALEFANRLLPSGDSKVSVSGFTARDRLDSRINRLLTKPGETAAQNMNQVPA